MPRQMRLRRSVQTTLRRSVPAELADLVRGPKPTVRFERARKLRAGPPVLPPQFVSPPDLEPDIIDAVLPEQGETWVPQWDADPMARNRRPIVNAVQGAPLALTFTGMSSANSYAHIVPLAVELAHAREERGRKKGAYGLMAAAVLVAATVLIASLQLLPLPAPSGEGIAQPQISAQLDVAPLPQAGPVTNPWAGPISAPVPSTPPSMIPPFATPASPAPMGPGSAGITSYPLLPMQPISPPTGASEHTSL